MKLPHASKLLTAALLLAVASALYWLLPIRGQLLLVRQSWQQEQTWPQVQLQAGGLQPGQMATVVISDPTPWAYVKLLVNGREATLQGYESSREIGLGGPGRGSGAGVVWQWSYTFALPDGAGYDLAFYHSCDTGCRPWAAVSAGLPSAGPAPQAARQPTRLGVVFPNPARDWHGKQGWVVELTYAMPATEAYWGIDDLAQRVQPAVARGLRVLLRVDYAPGQSLPPAGDAIALDRYLGTMRRLARDARLAGVYGFIVGSGYNTAGANSLSPQQPVTPEWAARLLSGYGTEPGRSDNVLATVRAEQATARVLVGPVTPWSTDQDGAEQYTVDAPWLNYMNTLVAALDAAARANAAAGIPLMAPDGFALQAPGRPELAPGDGALEPQMELTLPQWPGAQAGFRVFEQWRDIVNSYETTAGAPLFISATNTYHPMLGAPPAENYPAGWLTTAAAEVAESPQVAALIWYMDHFPHDDQWDFFSLTEQRGQMAEAAAEFDRLLQAGAALP